MAYLSERQCQLCVDRGVASTEGRPLGRQMHKARHQPNAIEVCVFVCAHVCIYVLPRWRYHVTTLGTSYVTKPDATFCLVR